MKNFNTLFNLPVLNRHVSKNYHSALSQHTTMASKIFATANIPLVILVKVSESVL
jgi:hypothetical protein